jgi:hypothetical protein
MALYTVGPREDTTEMTLNIEGRVTSLDGEMLDFCLDALKSNDNLILNIEKVKEYDFFLSTFICLLRRSALLLGKEITICGNPEKLVCLYSMGVKCSSTDPSGRCLCKKFFSKDSTL